MASLTFRVSFYSDGSYQVARPSPERLFYLKSWVEAGKTLGNDGNNFSAITLYQDQLGKSGGQAVWVMLHEPEKLAIQRWNNTAYGEPRWHYLLRPNGATGSIYIGLGTDDDSLDPMKWPRIAQGSRYDPFPRNQVLVKEETNTHVNIAGIPKSSDYSIYSPQTHPWLFHRIYCVYQKGGVVYSITETPQGIMYMPVWDPASGFEVSAGETGLWLPKTWLYGPV